MLALNIAVIGSGPASLVTSLFLRRDGHNVHIFEASPSLRTTGAGIQIPPNSSRLLNDLGLLEALEPVANEPETVNLRRYESGDILTVIPLIPLSRDVFGGP